MHPKPLFVRLLAILLACAAISCSAAGTSATLTVGMTSDQAIQALGPPDLKDSVPDPNHPGATATRYVWLGPGQAGIFSADGRVASIQTVETPAKVTAEAEAQPEANIAFDPITTPLNYAFFPIRAAFIYIGAGLNCVAGGACHKPTLPPAWQG
ncbi:MAG TPA: hypothetical protein VEC38_05265 [Candidatus Binataceae bacterium]|nr:hypothetical protein [Candidatus Binataceae bacterium]